jgi:hypothetical protein
MIASKHSKSSRRGRRHHNGCSSTITGNRGSTAVHTAKTTRGRSASMAVTPQSNRANLTTGRWSPTRRPIGARS